MRCMPRFPREHAGPVRLSWSQVDPYGEHRIFRHHRRRFSYFYLDLVGCVLQEAVFVYQLFQPVLYLSFCGCPDLQRAVSLHVRHRNAVRKEYCENFAVYPNGAGVPEVSCPRIRTVPVRKKRTWYSISLVSTLFLIAFASFVVLFYPYNSRVENVILFAVVVMIYCSVLWVVFETIRYMNDESKMELIGKNTEYLQGQLALAKENELAARTIRHDFRHHNQNIAALLQKGNI